LFAVIGFFLHNRFQQGTPPTSNSPRTPDSPVALAIGAGVEFRFVLTARRGDAAADLVASAADWLAAALVHAGAGAKTNAGYGRFELLERPKPPAPQTARRVSTHELELVTPAFLAGADPKDMSGCELRPSTLRGHLRWWWRTMHASHLGRNDLRTLESAIWGSTEQGGALSLAVERRGQEPVVQRFTTSTRQPLFYAAYGMAEEQRGAGNARFQVLPPAKWLVTLSARSTRVKSKGGKRGASLDAQQILRQGKAALWLLARYGAVGGKSRKGFGSFNDLEMAEFSSPDDCREDARKCRPAIGFPRPGEVRSASLGKALFREVETAWPSWDGESAMRKVATVYRKLVNDTLPKRDRRVFGLPRGESEPGRYASPLHWSLSSAKGAKFRVRMTAFLAPQPDLQTSTRVLRDALERAQGHSAWRQTGSARPRGKGRPRPIRHPQQRGPVPHPFLAAPTSRQSFRRSGQRLRVVLVEKRLKKRGRFTWFARDEESGRTGAIVNSNLVPAETEPGQTAEVVLASENAQQIQFRWPESRGRASKRKGAGQPRRTRH